MVYVDEDGAVDRMVDHLSRQDCIAVDTEANPMFAYRERMCLLQISSSERDYLVDPLADIDLRPMAPVFADSSIAKILHGAEFDVLQLKRALPVEIRGLFDTRVAAASLGFESPSLAAVLERWLGVKVDKAHQRSDWGRRPLSDGQLEYARDDTRYLIELSELLRDELHDAGPPHFEEVSSECRRLEMMIPDPASSHPDPDDWVRLKGASALDLVGKRILRDLNRFRHELAEKRDKPLFKVLPNEVLVSLARCRPADLEAIRSSRVLSPKLVSRYGGDLVKIIHSAEKKGELRRIPTGRRQPEDQLSREQRSIYESVRNLRKRLAERRTTDASLIFTRQMMVDLARVRPIADTLERLEATKLLEPWRIATYGEDLVAAIAKAPPAGSGGRGPRSRA